jgi:hypothetical protein
VFDLKPNSEEVPTVFDLKPDSEEVPTVFDSNPYSEEGLSPPMVDEEKLIQGEEQRQMAVPAIVGRISRPMVDEKKLIQGKEQQKQMAVPAVFDLNLDTEKVAVFD